MNQPQNFNELKVQLQPIIECLDMNVGTIRVLVINRAVKNVAPSYDDVVERIPQSITAAELVDINRWLLPLINFMNMSFGEFEIAVNNRKFYGLKPAFNYSMQPK